MRDAYIALVLTVVLSMAKISAETDKFVARERVKAERSVALVIDLEPWESWVEITADGGEDDIAIYSAEAPLKTGDEQFWWVVRTNRHTASGDARYVPDRVLPLWTGASLIAEMIREEHAE